MLDGKLRDSLSKAGSVLCSYVDGDIKDFGFKDMHMLNNHFIIIPCFDFG